jgi:hypothetical protein
LADLNLSKEGQMIVTAQEAKKRQFLGVDFIVLSHGPDTMIIKMLYRKEDSA